MIRLVFVLLLLAPITAHAAPDREAFAAFARGDYQAAIDQAIAKGSAEDLVLAARALNAISYFDFDRQAVRDRADRALALSEAAVAADEALAAARLQAAISHLLKGSRMAPVRALFSGVAGKARARLDEALALAPDDPTVLSTSAAWRIEVSRRGGAALAGADPQQGYAEFQRARALAPADPLVAHECAFRLFADGRAEWRAAALDCLDAAIAAPAPMSFERKVQAISRDMKVAVDGGPKALKAFFARQP